MAQRPADLQVPSHLSPDKPVPKPAPAERKEDPDGRDPTRYGDWELKGVAVDF